MKDSSKAFEKFSYPLTQTKNGKLISTGTGFFANYNGKIYLITNYHVAVGWDCIGRRLSHGTTYDVVHVEYFDEEKGIRDAFSIDATVLADNLSQIFFLHNPDIMIIYIDPQALPNAFPLHVIDLNGGAGGPKNGDIVFSCGYPTIFRDNRNIDKFHKSRTVSGVYLDDYSKLGKLGISIPGATDAQREIIKKQYKNFHFYFDKPGSKGASGSPVFYEKNNSETPDVGFAGIYSGNYDKVSFSVAIKADVIIYYLRLMQQYGMQFLDYNQLTTHSYHTDSAN